MWYLLKFDYSTSDASKTLTKFVGYSQFADAKQVFDHLELGYQLNTPLRAKGGKMINVSGAWLYESFKDHYPAAVEAVTAGTETLMYDAQEIEIDL